MKEGSSVTTTAILLCMFGALFALSLSKKLPWYLARKALHIGTGVIVIYAQAIGFDILIISVGIITLVLIQTKAVKIYPMQQYAVRKDKPSSDVGMLNFTLCTVLCTALGVSLVHISPVYFADPMGAIVGRNVRTPKIPFDGKKTIGGSLAVMFSAIASLMFFGEASVANAFTWGFLIALTEAYSGEWDNAAIAGLLALRYLILIAGGELVLSTALATLVPEIIGYALLGSLAFGAASIAGRPTLPSAEVPLYLKMQETMEERLPFRIFGKVVACSMITVLTLRGTLTGEAPNFLELTLFSVFHTAMGLVDELHHPEKGATLRARVSSWMPWAAYAALLCPIPYLTYSQEVFRQYALVVAACQMVSATKRENVAFLATLAVALPVVLVMSWQTIASWPIAGMVWTTLAFYLFEAHAEMRLVKQLVAWGFPSSVFTLFLNGHFMILPLVSVGLLPPSWLYCLSGGYQVAKLAMAGGALSGHKPKVEDVPTKIQNVHNEGQ